jgi:hypothetical protein
MDTLEWPNGFCETGFYNLIFASTNGILSVSSQFGYSGFVPAYKVSVATKGKQKIHAI